MYLAAARGHMDVVRFLISQGVNEDGKGDSFRSSEIVCLFIVKKANIEATDDYVMIDSRLVKKTHVSSVPQSESTPLHFAASKGRTDVLSLLLSKKANPDARDKVNIMKIL